MYLNIAPPSHRSGHLWSDHNTAWLFSRRLSTAARRTKHTTEGAPSIRRGPLTNDERPNVCGPPALSHINCYAESQQVVRSISFIGFEYISFTRLEVTTVWR